MSVLKLARLSASAATAVLLIAGLAAPAGASAQVSSDSGGEDELVRLDEIGRQLHLLAFPHGSSSSPFGESGLLESRETGDDWELTMSARFRGNREVNRLTALDEQPCP